MARVGFLGLGRMGAEMSRCIAESGKSVIAFDVSQQAREALKAMNIPNMTVAEHMDEIGDGTHMIVSSLPVSDIVADCVDTLLTSNKISPGTIWVDTTSGVPSKSIQISQRLAEHNVKFVDCGVAGGPIAAATGTLSAMAGGDASHIELARPVLNDMMAKIVHIGPVGSGHAVKSVNNTLLATNIWTAYEGLLILAKMGVDLDKALEAINASSGRSLVTEERIPRHVLNRKFDFGFSLGLMRKDIEICMFAINHLDIPSPVLRQIAAFWQIGEASLGKNAEHMEVVKVLERMTDARLEHKSDTWPKVLEDAVEDANSPEELAAQEKKLNELLAKIAIKQSNLCRTKSRIEESM